MHKYADVLQFIKKLDKICKKSIDTHFAYNPPSDTGIIMFAFSGRSDYQLGNTKVFLKDAHDLFLEQERDRVLTKKILILQRNIRGWVYRRRFLRLRAASVVVQKYWKGYIQRQRYKQMKVGYMRLQALIRARVLSHRFRHLRGHIVGLQVIRRLFDGI